jgi:hypothetical protein
VLKKRKPRTTGIDMCVCGYYNCDMMMGPHNPFVRKKFNKRKSLKQCIGCGKEICVCKRHR